MVDQNTIEQLLEDGAGLAREGRLLHATQLFRRVTLLDPACEEAWIRLSQIYVALGHAGSAERALLAALGQASHPSQVLSFLGGLQVKLGHYGRALYFFKRALLDEQSLSTVGRAQLHFSIGLVYLRRGSVRLAEHHLRRVRRLDPEFPRIHETLGEVLLRRNSVAEAVHVLKRATTEEPYSWFAHYLLGMGLAKLRQWEPAYDEFVAAVEVDPDEPLSWQMCGEMLMNLERLDEAERYLNKALQLDPQFSEAVADFGLLCSKRGEAQRALEYYDRALSLEPTNQKALRGKRELMYRSPSHA